MKIAEAKQLIEEGAVANPGPWVDHSRFAASAAERIARATGTLDPEHAYVAGLLHDIGRYCGRHHNRHLIDGYRIVSEREDERTARVCITHAFPIPNIEATFGTWDCTDEEKTFIEDFISSRPFDDYDRLIQLCDFLATAEGFVIVEKRMVDVLLRYGTNPFVVEKWKAVFDLKHEFDRRAGVNIYSLLDGTAENSLA